MTCRFCTTPIRQSFAHRFTEFATLSQIQGFYFVVTSRCRLEQFMWIVLILVCFILTITDSVTLFTSYYSEAITSEVNVVHNDSMVITSPEICVEIPRLEKSIDLDLENVTKISLADMGLVFRNVSSILHYLLNNSADTDGTEWEAPAYVASNIPRGKIRKDRWSWPIGRKLWLLQQAVALLHAITNAESRGLDAFNDICRSKADSNSESFENALSIHTKRAESLWKQFNFSDPAMRNCAVYRFFAERHVRMASLAGVVGYHLCQMIRWTSNLPDEPGDYCLPESIKFVGAGISKDQNSPGPFTFCSSLQTDFEFSPAESSDYSGHASETIRDSIIRYYFNYTLFEQAWFGQQNNDWRIAFDFRAPAALGLREHNRYVVLKDDHNLATISVLGELYQLDRSTKHCSSDQPRWLCQRNCVSEGIFRQRGCRQLDWMRFSAAKNQKFCSDFSDKQMSSVSATSNTSDYNDDFARDCSQSCIDACKTQLLSFNTMLVPDIYINQQLAGTTDVEFTLDRFSYPVFTENLKMSQQELISDFGGILGLYIGASFLALYHFVVFIIRVFLDNYEKFRCKNRKRSDSQLSMPQCNVATPPIGRRDSQIKLAVKKFRSTVTSVHATRKFLSLKSKAAAAAQSMSWLTQAKLYHEKKVELEIEAQFAALKERQTKLSEEISESKLENARLTEQLTLIGSKHQEDIAVLQETVTGLEATMRSMLESL